MMAGELVTEATGGTAKVAMVLGDYPVEASQSDQDMLMYGFRTALKDKPGMEISVVRTSSMGILSAEEIASNILLEYPDITAFYCTTAMDTVGVAQVVVDMNKVGKVAIVGYDNTEEILRYIDKGVIYGTLASNPWDIGYNSVKAMVEAKTQSRTSGYVATAAYVIRRDNVGSYLNSPAASGAEEGESP